MRTSPWTSTAQAPESQAHAIPPLGIGLLVLAVGGALAALQFWHDQGQRGWSPQALQEVVTASSDQSSQNAQRLAEAERLLQAGRSLDAMHIFQTVLELGAAADRAWASHRLWYARWQHWHQSDCLNAVNQPGCDAATLDLTTSGWSLLQSGAELPAATHTLIRQWLWLQAPLPELERHLVLLVGDARPESSLRALEEAARWALSQRRPVRSAELWLWAARLSPAGSPRLLRWHEALRALESAGQWTLLLNWLQSHEAWFRHDRQSLMEAVRLSRAAARHDLALRYVRLLLALTEQRPLSTPQPPSAHHRWSDSNPIAGLALGPRLGQWQRIQATLVARADLRGLRRAAWPTAGHPEQPTPPTTSPRRSSQALDLEVMELAYQVFIENRKLDEALALAQRVVRQLPGDIRWLKRLAQAAEWNQQPELALEHWWQLARLTDDTTAWEAVRRLSLGLLRDDAYTAYLNRRLRLAPEETAAWLELANVQERLGDPESAWNTLMRAWHFQPQPSLARALAELAERLGRKREAIQWWHRTAPMPWPANLAQRIALLHLLLDEREQALAVLRQAMEPSTGEADADDYRRLRAELAIDAGSYPEAIQQLRILIEHGQPVAQDLADWEYALELAGHDEDAAQAAALLWHQYRDTQALIRALTRWQNLARFERAETLLAGLSDQERTQLEHNPRFVIIAARQAWQTGQWPEAHRLYALAQRLAPQDTEVLEAVLWFTLDTQDVQAVRKRWNRYRELLEASTDLRVAVALTLGDIPEAWRLTAPTLRQRRHDALWLTQAADILQALDRHDEAWQLRLQAWRQVRRQPQDAATMQTVIRARLAAFLTPGDAEWAALREVAAMADTAASRSVLLAQWIQRGQYSAARAWMLRHLAPGLAQPGWAQLAVALAEDDRETLQRLLDDPRPLPRRDVVQAARRLDEAQAATLAAEGLDRYPDDDLLHEQWLALARHQRNRLSVELQRTDRRAWDELSTLLQWQELLTPHLRLSATLQQHQRSLQRPDLIGAVPSERMLQLRLDAGDARESWQWRLGWRDAWRGQTSLGLRWQRRWDRAQLGLDAGWAEAVGVTDNLRLAGQQDWFGLDVALPLRPTLTLNVRWSTARFTTQAQRQRLGHGQRLDVVASWQLEANPDGLRVDVGWNRQRYRAVDPNALPELRPLLPAAATSFASDFFVPASRSQWTLTVSHGLPLATEPRRGWWPFAALTWSRDSELGLGLGTQLGLSGSVLGNDRGLMGLQIDRNLGNAAGATRRLILRYWADL